MYKIFTDIDTAIELSDLIGGTVFAFGALYRVYPPNANKPAITPFWVSRI